MTADLAFGSLAALSAGVAAAQVSPVELVEALLDRIARHDPCLRAYITVCADGVRAWAGDTERALRDRARRGPLHGLPIAHKDILFTAGIRTTAHSRSLLDFVPATDATVVRRLADAGMGILGKTNTTEFAYGEMALFGVTRNPWDPTRYAGGSSAGAAAAVAAGLAVAATGTDTLGSIRVPASFSGVVGLKPTYGRVSRHGVTPLAWSLDHVGPIARTVRDAALLLNAMAGFDPADPATAPRPVPDHVAALEEGVAGWVVAVPDSGFFEGLEPDVDQTVRAALRVLEGLGARLERVRLPHGSVLPTVGRAITMAEAFAAHMTRLQRAGDQYGRRIRRRLGTGALLRAIDYQTAARLRREFTGALDGVLERADALVTPTTPFPAFPAAAQMADPPDSGVFTSPFNLSGHPAVSIPCGFTGRGLPVGLQLVGRRFGEPALLRLARAYEQATDWHRCRPPEPDATGPDARIGLPSIRDPDPPLAEAALSRPETPGWVGEDLRRQGLSLADEDVDAIWLQFQKIRDAIGALSSPFM